MDKSLLKPNIQEEMKVNDKFSSSNSFSRPQVEYKARKMYSFYDSAPFNIEGGQLSYNNELSLDELSKSVSFTFSHYKVEDQQ